MNQITLFHPTTRHFYGIIAIVLVAMCKISLATLGLLPLAGVALYLAIKGK